MRFVTTTHRTHRVSHSGNHHHHHSTLLSGSNNNLYRMATHLCHTSSTTRLSGNHRHIHNSTHSRYHMGTIRPHNSNNLSTSSTRCQQMPMADITIADRSN